MTTDRPNRRSPWDSPATPGARLAERPDISSLVLWLLCAYLLVLPVASWIVWYAGKQDPSATLNFDRARFAVFNAITLTGLHSAVGPESFSLTGQVVILLLTLFGALFSMIVGGLLVIRILDLPYTDADVVQSGVLFTGVLVLLGAAPLLATYRPFEALLLSASALGNSGLFIGNAPPGLFSWQLHFVLMPLAVLGSLGLPVLMELWDAVRLRGSLSTHSRTVLTWSAWLYVVPLVLFVLVHFMYAYPGGDDAPKAKPAADYLASASLLSLNARTFGLPVQNASELPRMLPWLLIPLMVIGGSTAGSAGGVKITTFAALGRGARQTLSGQNPGRNFGIAATWLAAYAVAVLFFFCLLIWKIPETPPDRLLFDTVSALSNVGLSYDTLGTTGPGLDVLAAAMLFGRLAPILILYWQARRPDEKAEIAVG